MDTHFKSLCLGLLLVSCVQMARAEEETCSVAGAVVTAVIVTAVVTLVIVYIAYLWHKKRKLKQGKHLILETDPEKGKEQYAFDNPSFKDAGLTPIGKVLEKNGKHESSTGKAKWSQWSPLGMLGPKSEKKRTVDDMAIEGGEVKVVALRSHDFTGLGFNICGNMRDGIFIKDVLHRGPASESGKLMAGDRIHSLTISFEHIVYEDALTILSYASPYEVIIEAKGGKVVQTPGQSAQPGHPLYRSSSSTDLLHIGKSAKKRLFQADEYSDSTSNYSSLQKTRSNATTLERSQSPAQVHNKQERTKKAPPKPQLNQDQLKQQLEQRISEDHKQHLQMKNDNMNAEVSMKIENETQKTESKHQKFGIKVFPEQKSQVSPKIAESQNDNNINLEKHHDKEQVVNVMKQSTDEVDKPRIPPEVKKREKLKPPVEPVDKERKDVQLEIFERNSLNGSGIKRDKDGIPQEIPSHMLNAAVAARRNRKGEESMVEEEIKSPKKLKGKAPAPPEEKESMVTNETRKSLEELKFSFTSNLDEIQSVEETEQLKNPLIKKSQEFNEKENEDIIIMKEPVKDYNSDSDLETDNQSSVNTIELNASDITIHQVEDTEEIQNRKTASTGDLSKIQKARKTSTGTLERAQSLDITDTGIPTLSKKRKAGKIEDVFDPKSSDEDLYGKALINKEPRLSLVLDGLNTFQRNRLKKSTEWGNLEDAILNSSGNDESMNSLENFTGDGSDESFEINGRKFDFGVKSPEFDALVNKINEIKQEAPEVLEKQSDVSSLTREIEIEMDAKLNDIRNKKNEIWPSDIFSRVNGKDDGLISVEKPLEIDVNLNNEDSDISLEMQKDAILKSEISEPQEEHVENLNNTLEKLSSSNKSDILEEKDTTDQLTFTLIDSAAPPMVETIPKVKESRLESDVEDKTPKSKPELKKQLSNQSEGTKQNIVQELSNFLVMERAASLKDEVCNIPPKSEDTNISDDIKVSRHSLGSLEASKTSIENVSVNNMQNNVSNIAVNVPKTTENNENTLNISIVKQTPKQEVAKNPSEETMNEMNTSSINLENGSVLNSSVSILNEKETKYSSKTNFPGLNNLEYKTKNNTSQNYIGYTSESPYHLDLNSANDSISSGVIEISTNDTNQSELYTTALDETLKNETNDSKRFDKLILTTPDLINNVTIAEAIHNLNNEVTIEGPSSLTLEISHKSGSNSPTNIPNTEKDMKSKHNDSAEKMEVSNKKINISQIPRTTSNIPKILSKSPDGKSNSSLTYVTEIQVVNSNNTSPVSDVEVIPRVSVNKNRNLDSEFESYIKNFETNVNKFESNIKHLDNNMQDITKKPSTKASPPSEKIDVEKELHKIQEIAEEQLKKLPEMRFTTSSYEGSRTPEKRQSQIEMLRSNFEKASTEKSPPKSLKMDVNATKSRIPIATTAKTPPMSPERRDSRNLDLEAQKDLIEMMTSTIHSTPLTSSLKYQPKVSSKNVTVTSIRTNSKIPSGLPTYNNRPPIPPRRMDSSESETTLQITTSNGGSENIRQWVFNQPDNSITNIVVENKNEK